MLKERFFVIVLATIILTCSEDIAEAGEHSFTVGAEGFYDQYHEPTVQVNTRSGFVTLKGSYTLQETYYFLKFDARASAGKGDYESPGSGTVKGMPQREGEFRAIVGATYRMKNNNTFSPFLGLGTRLYYDDSNGLVSSTGALAYDRAIKQVYIPLGVHLGLNTSGLRIDTTAEYDHLLWGSVRSYFIDVGRTYDAVNKQHKGYGLRGSILVGPQAGRWQIGPFVRYWDIDRSDLYTAPDLSFAGREPVNTRLQTGIEFLYHFNAKRPQQEGPISVYSQ